MQRNYFCIPVVRHVQGNNAGFNGFRNRFYYFFYNPNTHPREEYEIRKNENKRYAEKLKIPFVDADYDPLNWFARIKGLEFESGARGTL